MHTDPVADMLTRIRNAYRLRKDDVGVPFSQLKEGVAQVLKDEGFIADFRVLEQEPRPVIQVQLKYGPRGENIINHIQRVSRPGRKSSPSATAFTDAQWAR